MKISLILANKLYSCKIIRLKYILIYNNNFTYELLYYTKN